MASGPRRMTCLSVIQNFVRGVGGNSKRVTSGGALSVNCLRNVGCPAGGLMSPLPPWHENGACIVVGACITCRCGVVYPCLVGWNLHWNCGRTGQETGSVDEDPIRGLELMSD
jgi:hypothetical protein